MDTKTPYPKPQFAAENTMPLFKVWKLVELSFEGWRISCCKTKWFLLSPRDVFFSTRFWNEGWRFPCRRDDSHRKRRVFPKDIHAPYPSQTNQSLSSKSISGGLCDTIPPTVPMSMLSASSSHDTEQSLRQHLVWSCMINVDDIVLTMCWWMCMCYITTVSVIIVIVAVLLWDCHCHCHWRCPCCCRDYYCKFKT